jgi:hypothetical protein
MKTLQMIFEVAESCREEFFAHFFSFIFAINRL